MNYDLLGPTISTRSEIRQHERRTQGAEANHKGRQLEDQVADLLISYGANPVPFRTFSRVAADMFNERVLIRQHPYQPLVKGKKDSRIDMLYVHGSDGPKVAIECKVQDDGGSVDEKLYGVALHAASRWGFADHVWVVLSGDGFRKGWAEWLESGHRGLIKNPKPIRVFTSIDSVRVAARALVQNGDVGGRRR